MTENLDYLEELIVLGPVIIYHLGGDGGCLVSGGTEGGLVVANRVKNGDYEEYTAHDVSELSDFITALISIPVTKSTV